MTELTLEQEANEKHISIATLIREKAEDFEESNEPKFLMPPQETYNDEQGFIDKWKELNKFKLQSLKFMPDDNQLKTLIRYDMLLQQEADERLKNKIELLKSKRTKK